MTDYALTAFGDKRSFEDCDLSCEYENPHLKTRTGRMAPRASGAVAARQVISFPAGRFSGRVEGGNLKPDSVSRGRKRQWLAR